MPEEKVVEPSFRTRQYRWLKARRQLDLLNIDEEIMEMPVLVQEAAESASLAIEIRDSAKDDLNTASSEAASTLRSNPGANGKARSETQISTEIPLDPRYKQAQSAYSAARLDAGLWSSLVEAMRTKSSSLHVVAELVKAGFITQDYIMMKRRQQIREVQPPAKEQQ